MNTNQALSVYNGVHDKKGVISTRNAVIKRIKTGDRKLAERCDLLRKLYITDKDAYDREKQKLPAVTFSGIFSKRKADALIRHSGLVTIDIDGLPLEDIPYLLSELAQVPQVALAFVSPSGAGIKAVVSVNPIPTDATEHKGAYEACKEHFETLATEFGFEVDTSGSDVSRMCFLAHDPLAIVNHNPTPITWDREEYLTNLETQLQRTNGEYEGDADLSALNFISPDADYDVWLEVGLACHHSGLPLEVWDTWSEKSAKYRAGECARKWETFGNYAGRTVTWASVVHRAKQDGYEVPKSTRKPVKLFKSEYVGMLSSLDKARGFLSDVFEKGSRFFAIRTDTGTGKTENAVTYAMTKDVAIPTQSGTLRDEIVDRARNKEIFAWGYRGIRDTDTSDGYLPCIQSERFEVLRDKGFNPYKFVCDGCSVNVECKERGYLSQPARARASQLVALPFPTAFLDPRLRNWAKLYLPRGKDALILHDDLPVGALFYECRLSAKRLRKMYEQWQGTDAGDWAKDVLSALAIRDFELLRRITVMNTEAEMAGIQEALTQCINHKGVIVSPDEYLSSGYVNFSTTEACSELPQVDAEGFDVATLLGAFFTRYPRPMDAPCYFDTSTESFVFYLPPKPIPSKRKTLRIGFASATLSESLIKRVFSDIEFYDTALTEWVDGAQVFQLRTNRNPRGTVLNVVDKYTKDGERVWEWDGLNGTGETYYQYVLDFIKAHPNDKHAVFSYKTVIKEKQSELDAFGVVTAHFGDVAGLDTAFVGVKYFHILFCPFVDPFSVESLAKQLFGNDQNPLDRDAEGSLRRSEDGRYTDERVQLCHDTLVDGELRQAVGRARLNLYPNTVILWTSRELEGISHREETVLFDEMDWQRSENKLEKLHAIVSKRESAELNGDVQALVDTIGVSERTAYRQTQERRQKSKAERDAEVFRRFDAGETQQQIKDALGIGLATVNRILKQRSF